MYIYMNYYIIIRYILLSSVCTEWNQSVRRIVGGSQDTITWIPGPLSISIILYFNINIFAGSCAKAVLSLVHSHSQSGAEIHNPLIVRSLTCRPIHDMEPIL